MAYDADAQVGGRLASVGQRLVDSAARAIIGQSLEGLNAAVKAKVAAQSAANATPAGSAPAGSTAPAAQQEYRQPSQTQFAATIAREVAKDLIPPGLRRVLIIAAVILVIVLIWFLMT
jgi:hypothetical protein